MSTAPGTPEISIPGPRRKVVSAAVAAALGLASLGVGFAGGRLTAPDNTSAPGGFPGGINGPLPSGFPSNVPSGFPAPPSGALAPTPGG